MATIPAANYISNSARTQTEVKTALEDIIASLRQVPGAAQAELSSTIAAGSITPAGSGGIIVVETEALASTDDLTNIVTTNYPDGSCLLLRNNNAARFVVLKNLSGGSGQLNLDRGIDYVLDDTKKWIFLQRRGADWYEILRGPRRAVSLTVSKSSTFTVNMEDAGKTFLCSGSITMNLLAAASAGNGFVVSMKNTGTGTITIDANGSEKIDGILTVSVPIGWSYRLVCDGSNWSVLASNGPQPSINPIVNGNMEFWQRTTSATNPSGTTGPIADCFFGGFTNPGGTFVLGRSTNVPTVAQAGVLFNYSLEWDVTGVDTSLTGLDSYEIFHSIEGSLWRYYAQRQFTVSFWVMSSKTGIHSLSFQNNPVPTSQTYIAEYTINAADTWEYKTITVPASPSSGSWDYGSQVGLALRWYLAAGPTRQTSSINTWNANAVACSANQVNVMDSTSNFFRLTGVKLEAGSVATPIEYIPYEIELERCLRYFQKSFNYATAPVTNSGVSIGAFQVSAPATSTALIVEHIPYHAAMKPCTGPTVTFYNPFAANNQIRNTTDNVDDSGTNKWNNVGTSENAFMMEFTPNATNTLGDIHVVHWSMSMHNDMIVL